MSPRILLKGSFYLLFWSICISGHSTIIEGTFAEAAHFYEKCRPYEGVIRKEVLETAWRGERISTAILLWCIGEEVEHITFEVPDFTSPAGSIPSEYACLRSVEYVRADAESRPCGGYLHRDPEEYLELGDLLSNSLDRSLRPGCPSVYWITVDVPERTVPGLYRGTIRVSAQGNHDLELKMCIRVADYTLPPVEEWKFHLDLWQYPTAVVDRYNGAHPERGMEYWSNEHFKLLQKKYRMLAETGQKVITAHIKEGALGSPSMVRWIRSDTSWWYDFTAFDRYVDSCMSWGIRGQISCHSPVGWNSDSIPFEWEAGGKGKLYAPVGSTVFAVRWNHFLRLFKAHLERKGWFGRAVLYLDEVEPEKLKWLIELIDGNHPDWKIGLATFHTPSDFVASRVHDLCLMVGTSGNPASTREEQISTFYTSCNPVSPNNFISGDADPAENIWMGWHAQQLQYDGFLRWAFDYWIADDPLEQRTGGFTSGDFSFSYRNSNHADMEFFPSIRLELLREGIEDYEKIELLRNELEASSSPEDQALYNRLLGMLEEFSAPSAGSGEAGRLVNSARRLLNEFVTISK